MPNTKKANEKSPGWLRGPSITSSRQPVRILAIDPGTRCTGLAVFDSGELIIGKVKDFGYQKSTKTLLEHATAFLEKQIAIYRPRFVIIEKTFIYQNKNNSKLVVLAAEFKTIAKSHSIPVIGYAPRSARKIVLGDGNATKAMVADAICRRYPELTIHREQTHLWKDSYWSNMFDGVCVGLAFLIEARVVPPLNLSA